MQYFYNQGSSASDPIFLLLHGSGGKETDLLPIAQRIEVRNAVLAARGNVNEEGKWRHFKRHSNGSVDVRDLTHRTKELNCFIDKASREHHFNRDHVIAIGYSNGANIAASLLLHHGNVLKGAVLFHPMVPIKREKLPDLTGTAIFISTGATDSIVLPGESIKLKKMLESAGANVNLHITDYGHELAESEVEAAAEWYAEHFHGNG